MFNIYHFSWLLFMLVSINWLNHKIPFLLSLGTSLVALPEKHSVQFSSVTQSCPTLCNLMDCSTLGLPVHHQLLEFAQTHVHWVGLFLGAPKSLQLVTAVMKLKDTCSLEEKLMTKPRLHIKKKKHHFADKGPYSPKNYKAMVFPVVMYGY